MLVDQSGFLSGMIHELPSARVHLLCIAPSLPLLLIERPSYQSVPSCSELVLENSASERAQGKERLHVQKDQRLVKWNRPRNGQNHLN
mmetsp:Transcript_23221/g.59219  ORF Transcript_23221/g.59219 Transcript_23221/m.59219 type:complete len:88 (+) Transcript_23221:161-424(+)